MASYQTMSTAVPQQPHPTALQCSKHLEVDKRLELQKKVFTNCREYIVKHLNPDDIVDNLVSKHLIGDTACQQLCLPIKITQDKNRIIVNELSSGGPDTLEKFCAILNENSRIKHISDQLQKEWKELLQSSQSDGEQQHYSPPVDTAVVNDRCQVPSNIRCHGTPTLTASIASSEQSTVKTTDPLSVQFSAFVNTIRALLEQCHDKLEESKRICLHLTISNNSDELLFSDEQLKKINSCTTFNELFTILRKHWSLIDYSILKQIITTTDIKEAKDELQLFKTRMGSYEGMKIISENIQPEAISHEYITLSVIIDKPYQELTFEDFIKLRDFIFKYLDIQHYTALPHIKYLLGSLHLEWYVLKKTAAHMIKMAQQNEEIFTSNSVVFIQVDQDVVLDYRVKKKIQIDEKMAHPEEGKQHTAEYNALIKITEYLCKTLPIVDLLPKMTSKGVISLHDEAEIDSGHNDCVKVELFISKLFREMASGENERFYDFIEVMKESPKCGILVHKMEGWISHYKQSYLFPEVAYALIGRLSESSAPPPATTVNITHSVSDDDSLVTGKDSKRCMRLMQRYIIPKIGKEWDTVADFLDYSIQSKTNIRVTYSTPRERCTALLEDWVSTDNGVKPKTWKKLIEVLNEIEELEPVIEGIKQCLMSEGVTIDAIDMDQNYETPVVDSLHLPAYNILPHAFIVYAKEENDPYGDQVLCLSELLHNCGIDCEIDLYHIDENNLDMNIIDWPYWVENNLKNYTASLHWHVILVCSPTMISMLDEEVDAHVEMVAAHIDSQILRQHLQQCTQKFLPLYINDPSTDYPPSLSENAWYYFPYDKLYEMPEDITAHEVLDHPDFASLKRLVSTLTGHMQQEIPSPDLEFTKGDYSYKLEHAHVNEETDMI